MGREKKLFIGVFFGGRSCEHDVSIVSAVQMMAQMDTSQYEIVPVYISRDGMWYTGDILRDVSIYESFQMHIGELQPCFLPPTPGGRGLYWWGEKKWFVGTQSTFVMPLDIAFPVMHGMNGEDGTLQGLFELANIPYVGSGVMSSSVGMDKISMKKLFKGCGFPVVEGLDLTRTWWEKDKDEVLDRMETLSYPLYVKPANLGSSIGIGKAEDRASLEEAIRVALSYDRRVLVEKSVGDMEEVNCSVLGMGKDAQASVCEMPVSWQDFLTFEDKYLAGGKGQKGMEALSRRIPAPISDEMTKKVQALSLDIFEALDCRGVVRIDYMLEKQTQTLYVNEINSIPGSLAFYLWEKSGISYRQLIDILIEQALIAHAQKNQAVFSFDSSILKKMTQGSKGGKMGLGSKGSKA